MQRVLITGISGFVGSYLRRHLEGLSRDVYGFDLRPGSCGVCIFEGEVTDRAALTEALHSSRPQVIFHLAGILKSEQPESFYKVHVLGTAALFEAIVETGLQPRVIVAGSSAVYGDTSGKKSITELSRPRPATHYAVSKLAQEMIAMQYHRSHGLSVICVRTFNLMGPGLSSDMAPSAFARQIAQAEGDGRPAKIFTGDLTARRDYVDVRDAVRAYSMIAEHGKAGQIYNVCSGRATSIQECLKILLSQARVPMEAVLDHKRLQHHDVSVQIGSAKKLQASTEWKPEISVKQSLLDLLNDWRARVKSEKAL